MRFRALKIAIRYLLSFKGSTFIISFISFLGIVISTAGILLTNGVFEGFQDNLRVKLLGSMPNIILTYIGDNSKTDVPKVLKLLEKNNDIKLFSYFKIYHGAIQRGSYISAVNVDAMDFNNKKNLGFFSSKIKGSLDKKGVILGSDLAAMLGASLGDYVSIISPVGIQTPFGYMPKVQNVPVVGTLHSGIFDIDYSTVLMDNSLADKLFVNNPPTRVIEINLKNPFEASAFAKSLKPMVGDKFVITTWIDMNKPLFEALQTEERGIFFVLTLMIVVASFNITSLLFIKVKEKLRDIAIFRVYGEPKSFIMAIVLIQGFLLSFMGFLVGVMLSFVLEFFINKFKLIHVQKSIYLMSYVPVSISSKDILEVFLLVMFLSVLAGFIPSFYAVRENIVRILRND
ncbi:MAG: FtsX-like permease family protein [Hydrogenobaculum sp.]